MKLVHDALSFQYSIGDASASAPWASTPAAIFQYSVGDATAPSGADLQRRWKTSFNTLLEMPQGRVCVRAGACVAFQYSIGDAELSWSDRIRYAHCLFQYSIGDARSNIDGHVGGADDHLSILYWRCKNLNICGRSHWKVNHSFNTLLEMPWWCSPTCRFQHLSELSILYWRCRGFLCLVFVGF